MAQKTDTELTTQAQVIRDETTALANTKTRVYTNLKDAIDSKINNDKIIDEDNMASNSASHVPTQQSTKAYIDEEIANAALSIVTSWKNPVRVATTVNGTLATAYENGDTVDSVVIASGDRILLKNQTDQKENGFYIVAASGAPSRSADANTGSELDGAGVTVLEGTINANTTWLQTTDSVTIGVSNIVFTQLGTSVPPADGTTPGITKLYNNVSGTNTDGAPDQNSVKVALDLKAPLASPTLTGTPLSTTAAQGTNTTQIATTAFVNTEIAADAPRGLPRVSATGAVVSFAIPQIYGLSGDITGNITFSTTGAVVGMEQMMIHNDSTEPSFPSEFKRMQGSRAYVTGIDNFIVMLYISSTRILYTINQEI